MNIFMMVFIAITISAEMYGQTYMAFKSRNFKTWSESINDEIIIDTSTENRIPPSEYDKYQIDNYKYNTVRFRRQLSLFEMKAIYENNLPKIYRRGNTEYPDYPCILYDSLYISKEALLFSVDSSGKIKTIKNYHDNIENISVEYRKYIVLSGKLYIKNKKYYEKVFDANQKASSQISFLGETIFVEHYKEVSFYDKIFSNINEFYYHYKSKAGNELWMRIWFDTNYNLQLIQVVEGGFFRI